MGKYKRMFAFVLSFLMLFSSLPHNVFAEELNSDFLAEEIEEINVEQQEVINNEEPLIEEVEEIVPIVDENSEAYIDDTIDTVKPVVDNPEIDNTEEMIVPIDDDSISFESEEFLDEALLADYDFSSKRLIVYGATKDLLDEEKIVGEFEDIFLLSFETERETKIYFQRLTNTGVFVEPDMDVFAAESEVVEEVPSQPTDEIVEVIEVSPSETPNVETHKPTSTPEAEENSDTTTIEEANPIASLETVIVEEAIDEVDDVVIAVVDSGYSLNQPVFGHVSMLDDDGIDQNGHGSTTINKIYEGDPDALIVSIKALDERGKGTTASVLAAVKYAIEQNVDIISLPLSATFIGEQAILTEAIQEAIDKGIIVIGAAGNNNNNAKYYIPGGIKDAFIVGSANPDGTKTARSNFGDTVDFNIISSSTSEATAIATGLFSIALREDLQPVSYFIDRFIVAEDGNEEYVPSLTDGLFGGADVNQIVPITDDMMATNKKLVVGPHNAYTGANMWLYDGNGSQLYSGRMVNYAQVSGAPIDNSTDTFRFWMPQVGTFGGESIGAEVIYKRLSAEPAGSMFKLRLQPTFDGTRRWAAADVTAFGGFNVMLENSNKTEVTIRFYKNVNVGQNTPNGTLVNLDGDAQRVFMMGARGLSNETRSVKTVEWSAPYDASADVYTDILDIPREWWASRNFQGIDVYYSGNDAVTSKGFGINNADYYYDITGGTESKFYLGFIGSGVPGSDFTQGDPTMWFRIDFKEFIKVQKKIFTDVGGKTYQDFWELNEPSDPVTYSIFAEAPKMSTSKYDNWSLYDTLDQFLYINDTNTDIKVLDKETKEDKTDLFDISYDVATNKITIAAKAQYLTHDSYGFYNRIYEARITANRIQYEDMTAEHREIWVRNYGDYQIANKAYFTYRINTTSGLTEQFTKETDEVVAEWPHGLRVQYLEQGTESVLWAPHKDNDLKGGDEYSVESPDIRGYELVDETRKVVAGTMPTDIHIEKVYYQKTKIKGSYLTVTKSSDPESNVFVNPGETITYTLRADNSGIAKTDKYYIEDPIPVGTTYVEGSASDGGVYENGKIIWRNLDELNPRGSKEVTFQVIVNEGFDSVIYNSADYKENKEENLRETNLTVHPIQSSVPGPASLKATKTANTIVYNTDTGSKSYNDGAAGGTKTFTAPYSGTYHFALRGGSSETSSWWGSGYSSSNYNGGTVSGDINLEQGQTVYIYMGESGSAGDRGKDGSYNGGGKNENGNNVAGGGATHIATVARGELKNYKDHQDEVIAVAGGAGWGNVGNAGPFSSNFAVGQNYGGGGGWRGGSSSSGGSIAGYPVSYRGGGGSNYINENLVTNGVSANGTMGGWQHATANISWAIDVPSASFDGPGDIPLTVDNKAEIEYIVTIANDGVPTAKDVVITDVIPEGTEFIRAEDNGTYNAEKNRVEWYVGNLPTGGSKTVKYFVRVTGEKAVVENQAKFDRGITFEELSNAEPLHETNIVEHLIVDKITIEKEWHDVDNVNNYRPESIVIHFEGSNGTSETYTLNEANNWRVTITGLTIDPEVTYSVWEEVPQYYTSNATQENPIVLNIQKPLIMVENSLHFYKITTEVVNGTIDDPILEILKGENHSINYQPLPGYKLIGIEVDGVTVSTTEFEKVYPFLDVNQDHHIRVVYGISPMKDYDPVLEKSVYDSQRNNINGRFVEVGSTLYYELKIENKAIESTQVRYEDPIPSNVEIIEVLDGGAIEGDKIVWDRTIAPKSVDVVRFNAKAINEASTIVNKASAIFNDITIESNTVTNFTPTKPVKDVKDGNGVSINGQDVRLHDNLTYEITIKNNSDTEREYTVTDYIPKGLTVKSVSDNGTFAKVEDTMSEHVGKTLVTVVTSLAPKAEKTITINVSVDGELEYKNTAIQTIEGITSTSNETSNKLLLHKITTEVINGTISEDMLDIPDGSDRSVTYAPNEGYILEYIEIDGVKVDDTDIQSQKDFTNITEDHHIKVVYFRPQAPVKEVRDNDGNDINNMVVPFGEELNYGIKIKNAGSSALEYVVTDEIPSGAEFISADNNGAKEGNVVKWTLTLQPEEEVTLGFKVKVSNSEVVKIENTATQTVRKSTINTNPVVNYTPNAVPIKKEVKNASSVDINGKYVNNGDLLYYTITVGNETNETKTFNVKDVIPENSTVQFVVDGQVENNTTLWERSIPAHTEDVFNFVVKATTDASTIKNKALVSVDKLIDKETNEVINFTPEKPVKYVLDTDKYEDDIDKIMLLSGEVITYAIRTKNIANTSKLGIITDKLPEHVTFISADNGGKLENGVVKWELQFAPTEEKVVRVKVSIDESAKGLILKNKANVVFDGSGTDTNEVENPVMTDPIKSVVINGEDVNGKTVEVGTELTYIITVSNSGSSAKEFHIEDKLPNNTKFVEVGDGGSYDVATKTFSWDKTIDAKTADSVSFKVITTRHASYIPNVATVSVEGKNIETNKVDNLTPDPVVRGDLVSVLKGSIPKSGTAVEPNQEITYTLLVRNTGASVSGTTTITDPLPGEVTYVEGSASDGGVYEDGVITWTVSGLKPNDLKLLSFKAVVNADVKDVMIRNYANYSTDTDLIPGIKTTNEVVHPVGSPEPQSALAAVKDVAPTGEVRRGDLLNYTISLTNYGYLAEDVVITDTVPEGVEIVEILNDGTYNAEKNRLEWYLGSVDKNKIKEVRFVARVLIREGVIHNQAEFDKDIPFESLSDSYLKNTTNITENPVIPYEVHGDIVTVRKMSDPVSGSIVENGQEITYTLRAFNNSDYTSGVTTINDMIPEYTHYAEGSASDNGVYNDGLLTWKVEGIEPHGYKDVTFKVIVDEDIMNAIIRNHATYYSDTDVTPIEKSTNEVVHGVGNVIVPPALEVIKENDPHGFVKHGEEITYTLRLFNNGGSVSKDTVITDTIPQYTEFVSADNGGKLNSEKGRVEWYLGDVPENESRVVSFVVKVTGHSGTIYNHAQFDNLIPEDMISIMDPINSSNYVENYIEEPVIVKGDYVTVYKSSDPKSGTRVERGQEIVYTLTAVNTGTTSSETTEITDTLSNYLTFVEASDGGTIENGTIHWTFGEIKPGESKSVTFKVLVNDNAYNAIIKNHALYKSSTDKHQGFKETNETVHATDNAPLPAALEIVKSSNKKNVVVNGDDIIYTLKIINNGGEVSHDTVITDEIPEGTTFVSAGNGGNHNSAKKRVEWYIGELKPEESKEVTFTVKVNGEKAVIDNQALFDNNIPKEQLSTAIPKNSSNILQHVILATLKDLKAEKTVNPTGNVKTGDVIEYSIKLTNTSKLLSKDTVIVDSLPDGTEFVSADHEGKLNGKRVEWYIGDLQGGKDVAVKFKVKVTKSSGEVKNIANYGNNIPKTDLSKSNPEGKTNEVVNPIVNPAPKEPVVNTGELGRNIFIPLGVSIVGLIALVFVFMRKDKK